MSPGSFPLVPESLSWVLGIQPVNKIVFLQVSLDSPLPQLLAKLSMGEPFSLQHKLIRTKSLTGFALGHEHVLEK